MPTSTPATEWGRTISKMLFNLVIFFFLVFFIFKCSWDILAPDLFPGAVEQGLVARTISWWTACKLAGSLALICLFFERGRASSLRTGGPPGDTKDAMATGSASRN